MKKFIIFSFFITLIYSCGPNVSFVNPQPVFLDDLSQVPSIYQGVFIDLNHPNEEPIIISNNSIIIEGIEVDSFVVKKQGNYVYFNIMNPNGYFELYIARIVSYSADENIQVSTVYLKQDKLKYFDVSSIRYENNEIEGYILNDLNTNQLNLYRSLGYDINKNKRFSSQYKRVK